MLDVQDLLASDVKIVDATTRTADPGRGVQILRFPGTYMPDGRDCVGTAPERLEPSILRGWCNQVRSEWSARQNRKEAEESRLGRAAETHSERQSGGPEQPTAASNSGPDDGEAGEESMARSLEAEVARWARRVKQASEEFAGFTAQATDAATRRDQYSRNLTKAQRLLDFYLKSEQEGDEL